MIMRVFNQVFQTMLLLFIVFLLASVHHRLSEKPKVCECPAIDTAPAMRAPKKVWL